MCGILGVVAKNAVNQVLYDGLLVLQHRGQDAAGIVTAEGATFHMHKGGGMVRDVFRTRNMRGLLGGIFGFARGLLIVMVAVLLAGLTPLPRQPAWANAVLSPPLEALASALKPWLPQVFSRNISYD